jgi:hypothetical protein
MTTCPFEDKVVVAVSVTALSWLALTGKNSTGEDGVKPVGRYR